jgi:23S rRNA (adenine2503-C2)-methyltransferase
MPELKEDIRNLSLEELKEAFNEWGEPEYRAIQIFKWLYQKNVQDFSRMTDFPKELIAGLEKRFALGPLPCLKTLTAKDGTKKFLWQLADGHSIETVLIPEKSRKTLCLSTQVGCKFGCPFCVSGSKGFIRQLRAAEIVGQILEAQRLSGVKITNVVMMGIGEPLDNYENLVRAIRIINRPEGLHIGSRKITVSTCGLVPGIMRLKQLGLQIELSVSLQAATDDLRNRLVPVNRKYNLEELFTACREYFEATDRVITFEYTLIEGLNDSDSDARRLGNIARKLKAKVNLIPCNPNMSPRYRGSTERRVKDFQRIVRSRGARVTTRRTRGSKIQAACGQLAFDRAEDEKEDAPGGLKGGQSFPLSKKSSG